MGGCFSSSSTKKEESLSKGKPAAASATVHREPAVQRDSRPPETEAEETVKEVLLETPRPRSTPSPTTRTSACEDANSKQVETMEKGYAAGVPLDGIAPHSIDGSNGCDSISEDASEAWSVSATSETLSASATKAERRRGAVAESGMRATREERSPAKNQRKRSVSGDFACRRDRSVAVGCGSGRSSFSPAGRRSEHAAVGRTNSAREFASSRASRRALGERSGRRSLSPVMKRAAELGQRVGQRRAPGASAARANGTKQQMRGEEGEKKLCVQDEGIVGSAGEAKESLENPLVSLECFIFL